MIAPTYCFWLIFYFSLLVWYIKVHLSIKNINHKEVWRSHKFIKEIGQFHRPVYTLSLNAKSTWYPYGFSAQLYFIKHIFRNVSSKPNHFILLRNQAHLGIALNLLHFPPAFGCNSTLHFTPCAQHLRNPFPRANGLVGLNK
jgi:hypothetical protein